MKIRLLSAFIMLLIVIPVYLIGGYIYAGVVAILSILAFKEILDLKKSHKEIPKVVSLLGVIATVYLVVGNYGANMLNYRSVLIPLLLLLIPVLFYKNNKYNTDSALYLLGWVYLIGIGFNLIITLRNLNFNILIYLILIAIFTDTFAYIIGRLIGKHKLCPKISPHKTIEGFVGGLVGGSITALIAYHFLVTKITFPIIIITMILSVIGQIGDLYFSKVKRENDIKDYSNLIPGHGGILDRLDSILFIVICYVIIFWTI